MNTKKYIKIISIVFVLLAVTSVYYFVNKTKENIKTSTNVNKETEWRVYSNTDPVFSFSYLSSWGNPRINSNIITRNSIIGSFSVDFNNFAFVVSNGSYFSSDENGNRPTVSGLINYYKIDMAEKNEVKYFQTEDIKVDGRPSVRVEVDTLEGDHYTDVYIYEKLKDDTKFILITADRKFVDIETFNKILSTFKFIK